MPYSLKDWTVATKQTNVIFNYTMLGFGQSGRKGNSGLRQGTRNLDLVPASKHPVNRVRKLSTRRYYDQGRRDWRSFKSSNFGNIQSFQSKKTGRFIKDPVKAGVKGVKFKR